MARIPTSLLDIGSALMLQLGLREPDPTVQMLLQPGFEGPPEPAGFRKIGKDGEQEKVLTIGAGLTAPVFKEVTGLDLNHEFEVASKAGRQVTLSDAGNAHAMEKILNGRIRPFLDNLQTREGRARWTPNQNERMAIESLLYNVDINGNGQFKYLKDKNGNLMNGRGGRPKRLTKAYQALRDGDRDKFVEEAFGKNGFISGGLLTGRRNREYQQFIKPLQPTENTGLLQFMQNM